MSCLSHAGINIGASEGEHCAPDVEELVVDAFEEDSHHLAQHDEEQSPEDD
jgi:hypothetical protein